MERKTTITRTINVKQLKIAMVLALTVIRINSVKLRNIAEVLGEKEAALKYKKDIQTIDQIMENIRRETWII